MKYTNEFFTSMKKNTLSVEAFLCERPEDSDKPLVVFDDKFSRFKVTIIGKNSEYVYFNLPLTSTGILSQQLCRLTTSTPSVSVKDVRFFVGELKGKTPTEVLLENYEQGKKKLNEQYVYLKQNVDKYPKNKEILEEIKRVSKIPYEELQKTTSEYTTLLNIGCRPLTRKQREDGFCFCYEGNMQFNPTRNFPITINIKNYYAPVERKENNMLNVQLSKKDVSSEKTATFSLSLEEFADLIERMKRIKDAFYFMHFSKSFAKTKREDTN